jgi:hypothetical protein
MAEPVDAPVSKTGGREAVRVRVPLSAPQVKMHAVVAESADAHGSGPCPREGVEVQVLSTAPGEKNREQTPKIAARGFDFRGWRFEMHG